VVLWTGGCAVADRRARRDICRVGARRLPAERSDLTVAGPHGEAALQVLRNYAI
jgi:hypothetical protein